MCYWNRKCCAKLRFDGLLRSWERWTVVVFSWFVHSLVTRAGLEGSQNWLWQTSFRALRLLVISLTLKSYNSSVFLQSQCWTSQQVSGKKNKLCVIIKWKMRSPWCCFALSLLDVENLGDSWRYICKKIVLMCILSFYDYSDRKYQHGSFAKQDTTKDRIRRQTH